MHDEVAVGVLHRVADLEERAAAAPRSPSLPRRAAVGGDRHALDPLHDEEGTAVGRSTPPSSSRAMPGCCEPRQDLPLAQEAARAISSAVHAVPQQLERHPLLELAVGPLGQVDLAHAAAAELAEQAIGAPTRPPRCRGARPPALHPLVDQRARFDRSPAGRGTSPPPRRPPAAPRPARASSRSAAPSLRRGAPRASGAPSSTSSSKRCRAAASARDRGRFIAARAQESIPCAARSWKRKARAARQSRLTVRSVTPEQLGHLLHGDTAEVAPSPPCRASSGSSSSSRASARVDRHQLLGEVSTRRLRARRGRAARRRRPASAGGAGGRGRPGSDASRARRGRRSGRGPEPPPGSPQPHVGLVHEGGRGEGRAGASRRAAGARSAAARRRRPRTRPRGRRRSWRPCAPTIDDRADPDNDEGPSHARRAGGTGASRGERPYWTPEM